MEHVGPVGRLASFVRRDPKLGQRLLTEPETVLEEAGIPKKDLDVPPRDEAMERSLRLLSAAGLATDETPVSSWKKLGAAAETELSGNYEVELYPFGMTLLERAPVGLDWTATGGVTCTYDPWDGCSPDPDG